MGKKKEESIILPVVKYAKYFYANTYNADKGYKLFLKVQDMFKPKLLEILLKNTRETFNILDVLAGLSTDDFKNEDEFLKYLITADFEANFIEKDRFNVSKYISLKKVHFLNTFYSANLDLFENYSFITHSNALNTYTTDANSGLFYLPTPPTPFNFLFNAARLEEMNGLNLLSFQNNGDSKKLTAIYQILQDMKNEGLELCNEKFLYERYSSDFIKENIPFEKIENRLLEISNTINILNDPKSVVKDVNYGALKTITLPFDNSYRKISILHGTSSNKAIDSEIMDLYSARFTYYRNDRKSFLEIHENLLDDIDILEKYIKYSKDKAKKIKAAEDILKGKDATPTQKRIFGKTYDLRLALKFIDLDYNRSFYNERLIASFYSGIDNLNFLGTVKTGMKGFKQSDFAFSDYVKPIVLDDSDGLEIINKDYFDKRIKFLFRKMQTHTSERSYEVKIRNSYILKKYTILLEEMAVYEAIAGCKDKNRLGLIEFVASSFIHALGFIYLTKKDKKDLIELLKKHLLSGDES